MTRTPPKSTPVDKLPATAARLKRVLEARGFAVEVKRSKPSAPSSWFVVRGARPRDRGIEHAAGAWRDGKTAGAAYRAGGWPSVSCGVASLIKLLDDEVASA